jgi:hypothetical protein
MKGIMLPAPICANALLVAVIATDAPEFKSESAGVRFRYRGRTTA